MGKKIHRMGSLTAPFFDKATSNGVLEELITEVIMPFCHPQVPKFLGVRPMKGLLLHGPPGCGKTTLARAIANETGVPFYPISAQELVSGSPGAIEENIRSLFKKAYQATPSIVFIDEIDAIASKRELEQRIVSLLMTCMDQVHQGVYEDQEPDLSKDKPPGYVLVIGATNKPDTLDEALRRPGRFDRAIALSLPDEAARAEILSMLTQGMRLDGKFDLYKMARATPGFSGADLKFLVDKAGNLAMKRITDNRKTCWNLQDWWKRPWYKHEMESLSITMADFEDATKMTQPSLRKEGFSSIPNVTWNDVGGLSSIRNVFEEYIVQRIKNPKDYEEMGLNFEAGVLLFGPPGCGKTLIAKAVANEAGANFIHIKGPEIVNKYVGESESEVRKLFARARTNSPCIIFFDEIDSLTTKRGQDRSRVVDRIVNQLLIELDGADDRQGVFVIGATNRIEVMDEALLREGRFGKKLYVPLPDANERAAILKALARKKPIDADVDLDSLARMERCNNLSGADLASLVNEAAMFAIREKRLLASEASISYKCSIKASHFEHALSQITPSVTNKDSTKLAQPSLRKEGFSSIPNVTWNDVGGLHLIRNVFDEYIIQRIKNPKDYEEMGLKLEAGVLLFGPPGCGKTLIAKAVANEAGANFIHIKGPEILNKYVGESESEVRKLFARARTNSPCILFFDEIDALTTKRGQEENMVVDRIVNQLLIELDGADDRQGIFVIGATNRIEVMDEALLREGRFGKKLYVPLPDANERAAIMKALVRNKPIDADVNLDALSRMERCNNLSGADLASLVNEAAMFAIREKRLLANEASISYKCSIKASHFEQALSKITPSVTYKQREYYDIICNEMMNEILYKKSSDLTMYV
ncbi:cell division control protein 48 homolog C-like [Carex rostrata]